MTRAGLSIALPTPRLIKTPTVSTPAFSPIPKKTTEELEEKIEDLKDLINRLEGKIIVREVTILREQSEKKQLQLKNDRLEREIGLLRQQLGDVAASSGQRILEQNALTNGRKANNIVTKDFLYDGPFGHPKKPLTFVGKTLTPEEESFKRAEAWLSDSTSEYEVLRGDVYDRKSCLFVPTDSVTIHEAEGTVPTIRR